LGTLGKVARAAVTLIIGLSATSDTRWTESFRRRRHVHTARTANYQRQAADGR
jgi:hypothetical protein